MSWRFLNVPQDTNASLISCELHSVNYVSASWILELTVFHPVFIIPDGVQLKSIFNCMDSLVESFPLSDLLTVFCILLLCACTVILAATLQTVLLR